MIYGQGFIMFEPKPYAPFVGACWYVKHAAPGRPVAAGFARMYPIGGRNVR